MRNYICRHCGTDLGTTMPIAFAGGTLTILKIGQAGLLDVPALICLNCGKVNHFQPNYQNMAECMARSGTIPPVDLK